MHFGSKPTGAFKCVGKSLQATPGSPAESEWTAMVQLLADQFCFSADESGQSLSIPIDSLYLAPHGRTKWGIPNEQ